MTDRTSIDQAADDAFKALQAKARAEHGGNTQPLLVVYAVESFLRRLALSAYAQQMVLKGGMLMAANNIRRMTKDADLAAHGVANDEHNVREIVVEIAELTPEPHDGVVIDVDSIRTETMREDEDYHGVRCKLVAQLGRAKVPLALDFSFGDPERSTIIELDSVIDQPSFRLQAYPLSLNLAEKIITMMQRRDTNTRDRDFADLWVSGRLHRFKAAELRAHIADVAERRAQPLMTMTEALANMPDRQQPYSAMVQRMSYLYPPPELWTDLITGVIEFVDPLIDDRDGALAHWDRADLRWK